MNPKTRKDAISIHNPWLIKEQDSSEGTIVNLSFIVKKDNKPVKDVEFVIYVNGQEPQLTSDKSLRTNEHGFGSASFITKANEVKTTIIIENTVNKEICHKDSPKLILVEKKDKPSAQSFYQELNPDDGANSILSLGNLDDKTADTDRAFNLLNDWLSKKSLYEKTWFILAFNKAKKNDKEVALNFIEQFIYFHYQEENGGENKKNELAKNTGLLPPVDVFKTFNTHLDLLQEKNSNVYEKIIELLSSVDSQKVSNFQFNCSFLNGIEFLTIMSNIAASPHPKKAAEVRGLFNKQKQTR